MILSMDTSIIPNVRLIGHVIYMKPWSHFGRVINEHILYVIKSGEMYLQEGECKYELKKGDFFLLQPSIPHKGYKKACCDYYYIHFKHPAVREINDKARDEIINDALAMRKQSLASNYLSETPPSDSLCFFQKHYHLENESEYIFMLQNAVDEFYKKYENYKKLVSCKTLELFVKVSREFVSVNASGNRNYYGRASIKAQNIMIYLNNEYYKKISAKDIENLFESNYDYLNRIFQKITGYTIFNYLNIVRINKAKELIETSRIKFSEVAYLVGIDDPYYFSKLFKKYTGITPTQYWEKVQKLIDVNRV